MGFKPTLQAAIDRGAAGVTVFCRRCASSKDFTAEHALESWGTDATFLEIARRARCRQCREPAFEAAPKWKSKANATGAPTPDVPADWPVR